MNSLRKPNVIGAAAVGVLVGVVALVFFAFLDRIPLLACLFTPVALLLSLALPVFVGALAAAWTSTRGWTQAPSGMYDGAVAAFLAELVNRAIEFCASVYTARSFFLGPRVFAPAAGPATQTLFSGVWSLGWLVISLIVAALLGALGGLLYRAFRKA